MQMMQKRMTYPVIDCLATGRAITELRKSRGFTVRDVQTFLGFENPQAVYKWQRGESLPSLDNLVALSRFLQVPMDEIIVLQPDHTANEPQAVICTPSDGCTDHSLRLLFLPDSAPAAAFGRTAAILAGMAGAENSGGHGGRCADWLISWYQKQGWVRGRRAEGAVHG